MKLMCLSINLCVVHMTFCTEGACVMVSNTIAFSNIYSTLPSKVINSLEVVISTLCLINHSKWDLPTPPPQQVHLHLAILSLEVFKFKTINSNWPLCPHRLQTGQAGKAILRMGAASRVGKKGLALPVSTGEGLHMKYVCIYSYLHTVTLQGS